MQPHGATAAPLALVATATALGLVLAACAPMLDLCLGDFLLVLNVPVSMLMSAVRVRLHAAPPCRLSAVDCARAIVAFSELPGPAASERLSLVCIVLFVFAVLSSTPAWIVDAMPVAAIICRCFACASLRLFVLCGLCRL